MQKIGFELCFVQVILEAQSLEADYKVQEGDFLCWEVVIQEDYWLEVEIASGLWDGHCEVYFSYCRRVRVVASSYVRSDTSTTLESFSSSSESLEEESTGSLLELLFSRPLLLISTCLGGIFFCRFSG